MDTLKRPVVIAIIAIVIIFVGAYAVMSSKSKSDAPALAVNKVAPTQTVIIINPGGDANGAIFAGFEEALRAQYPGDASKLVIITKNAMGDQAKLKLLVTEAVSEKPSLIAVATGDPLVQALNETKESKIPIVAILGDPAVHGYVVSNQSSGVNVTGVAHTAIELTPKRFEILKKVYPKAKRVAVFYDTACGVTAASRPSEKENTPKLGLEVTAFALSNPTREQVIEELKKINRKDFDSILFYPHLSLAINGDLFLKKAREEKLAIVMPEEFALKKGAIASYGPNFNAGGKQLARLAIKVLGGINPKHIPFEQSQEVKFAVSIPNTKALGIEIPEALLKTVDLVVTE